MAHMGVFKNSCFGIRGRSYSNFLASTVGLVIPYEPKIPFKEVLGSFWLDMRQDGDYTALSPTWAPYEPWSKLPVKGLYRD